jgi:hypothetical protein
MARRLNLLADHGEADCDDDSCAVLYGVIRDCAYKIRGRAEHERREHLELGKWDDGGVPAAAVRPSGGER